MSDLNSPEYWTDAYKDERDHWDLEGPTPVFTELLENFGRFFPGFDPVECSVFIPCSGRGYDALLFAEHGFHVTAVDIAKLPLVDLEREASTRGLDLTIMHGDMFQLPEQYHGTYDFCLEYTCYCAIEPSRRDELISLFWRVLKPGGVFIGLIFPIDPRPAGPPFSIDAQEFQTKMRQKFTQLHSGFPATSVKPRAGKEILSIWQKPIV